MHALGTDAEATLSKLLRNVASSTVPILPCHAAPAFETTKSTPPYVAAILSNAARTCAGSVTSQAMAKPFTLETSRSITTTSAPSLANAAAVAAPMPEAPPVTAAMRRASGFSAAELSLACSSDQYSMSKMSGSGMHW